MKICFVVDAGSPIAKSWINYFIENKQDVVIISSYPCLQEEFPGVQLYNVPLFFSRFASLTRKNTKETSTIKLKTWKTFLKNNLNKLRHGAFSEQLLSLQKWLSPLELIQHVKTVKNIIDKESPSLVHAMRIPFEGILAAKSVPQKIPLIVSVWGNDFTLFSSQNPLIARQTKKTLSRVNALHCDCQRDLNLSYDWGFSNEKPSIVVPGAGGIKGSLFCPAIASDELREKLNIPSNAQIVINPRGFRGYVRNDVFFQAANYVIKQNANVYFLCSSMKGNPVAERFVKEFNIEQNIRLLPNVEHQEMVEFFRLAQIAVSPSLHDGTPNTLLEAMACGCFPIAGDIESLKEWITNGVNGILCDPNSPKSLAKAIIEALEDEQLLKNARQNNLKLVKERVEYQKVMLKVEEFYNCVVR